MFVSIHQVTEASMTFNRSEEGRRGWVKVVVENEGARGPSYTEITLFADDIGALVDGLKPRRGYYNLTPTERTATAVEAIDGWNKDWAGCDESLDLESGTSERCAEEYCALPNRQDTK